MNPRVLQHMMTDQFMQRVPVGVAAFDADGRVVLWNSSMERLSGVSSSAILGMHPGEMMAWWAQVAEAIQSAVRDGRQPATVRVPCAGEERPRTWRVQGYALEAGLVSVVVFAHDISHEVELHREVERQESMASFGKLAAGVAHEMNNPLDGAIRYMNLAVERLGEEDVSREYLLHAKEGLNRMVRIIRSLLEFAKQASVRRPHLADVASSIDNALNLAVRLAFEPTVKVENHVRTGLPRVVDFGLDYAFSNVIKNAYDAMPQGGTLTITAEQRDGSVVVSFADTGCGIPDEVRARIFEPFFTTKPIGKGTGLGLAICQEIVSRSEGRIEIESSVGKGTMVSIHLPVREKRAPSEVSS